MIGWTGKFHSGRSAYEAACVLRLRIIAIYAAPIESETEPADSARYDRIRLIQRDRDKMLQTQVDMQRARKLNGGRSEPADLGNERQTSLRLFVESQSTPKSVGAYTGNRATAHDS